MSKAKILWSLFVLQVPLTVCGIAGVGKGGVFTSVVTYLPLVILLLHACWTLSVRRGLTFIALAASVGWAAEAISLHYGTLFGGDYTYPAQASLFGVPLAVITYWAVFIYMGYWLVSTFSIWLGREKPNRKHAGPKTLCLTVVADGLAVTAIDLFMDPTSVKAGAWTWVHGGSYFGVPIGNFVGWFLVTVVVTGVFRSFEYRRPRPEPNVDPPILMLPVVGYLLTGVAFLVRAISYDMPLLAFIGTIIVILPAAANLVLYARRGRSKAQALPST